MMTDSEPLTCELEITPVSPGEAKLAFLVLNPGNRPVQVDYFTPFTQFELSVSAKGKQVPLIQPGYDTGVQLVRREIAPGETIRIETPIKLVFDPQVPPSGGDIPTRWTLKHAPVSVNVTVTLRLGGATVMPCQARWVQ